MLQLFIPLWKVTKNTMSVLLFTFVFVAQKKIDLLLQMICYCIL